MERRSGLCRGPGRSSRWSRGRTSLCGRYRRASATRPPQVLPVAQPDMLCCTRLEPVGVGAHIIPSNFPLLIAVWKIVPALAARCTTVLKPAEQTPLTALRLGERGLEAGIPKGLLNVITGDDETGAALVDHPGVDKVAFFGSTAVGIWIKAGRDLRRLTLELRGKSRTIILPDADVDAAVKEVFQAIHCNFGQACKPARGCSSLQSATTRWPGRWSSARLEAAAVPSSSPAEAEPLRPRRPVRRADAVQHILG